MPQNILNKLQLLPFKALPLLNTGKRQTIAAAYLPDIPTLSDDVTHTVPLPDGDQIVLIENRPLVWPDNGRIVLLVHGLTGSARSKYLVRLAHKLTLEGFLVMRMNLRGCGLGHGLAKHLYHSGRSEDTRAVLGWLAANFPNSKVTQAGFSLGANITLKMAGEDGQHPSGNLDSVIAVSPPLDLEASVKLLIHKNNRLFNDFFVKGLLGDIQILHETFPELPKPSFPKLLNIYQFDDLYTAPRSGFVDAKDYYTRSSSKHFIDNITLPTFLLYAKDDPVISRRSFLKLPHKKDFDVLITSRGGHVGWLGYTGDFGNWRWMDKAVVNWIKWFDRQ
ncbi:YheT family hydrolase [Candidatus Berkiella aquae]|uniref:Alpha/beta fold hydrolase n=1 Tax=Candidatus Berkiella aquae TaxID=295108 RepID=A0A0Q9YL82_9GAMM|nr:alpha/beta fold hydrolase [Candidatus Berkiella aquae]MCS5711387.1 alpha/beta fold hydrolase [Candidatus Berkiella aquae]